MHSCPRHIRNPPSGQQITLHIVKRGGKEERVKVRQARYYGESSELKAFSGGEVLKKLLEEHNGHTMGTRSIVTCYQSVARVLRFYWPAKRRTPHGKRTGRGWLQSTYSVDTTSSDQKGPCRSVFLYSELGAFVNALCAVLRR